MKISLCMIVKDETEVLARCLDSVKDCVDEIVLADTGSTDGTKELCRRYTPSVFSYPWNMDFAAARNEAFSRGNGDYLMWLDADDYLSPEDAAKLRALKTVLAEKQPDMVFCPYDVAFDENGKATQTFYRERLIRREAGFRWQGRVHECIPPHGKIIYADCRIRHLGSKKERGARNLHIYQKWAAEEKLNGRDLFYYGRELFYNRLYPEAIAVLEEMLAGAGWYVNKIEACKVLAQCKQARGETLSAITDALARSFRYGEPRASVLCEMGAAFKRERRWKEAAFWYESALRCSDHAAEGDFESPACRDIVPLLELTCCYTALGRTDLALQAHERAEALFPEHPSVRHNRAYFRKLGFPQK